MSLLTGKMQHLYIGSEYKITAKLEYNAKYKSYQYIPSIVSAIMPKSEAEQKRFLESILTKKQSETLLTAYPNIVEDIVNKCDDIDLDKLSGIGQVTYDVIREKIISNYVISDILIMLQPLGVTYAMIKKLLDSEPNPVLLKEKLLENPYIMTRIRGLGFKKVDSLALKISPELRVSQKRIYAFLKYFLEKVGESEGHTWITLDALNIAARENIIDCYDLYQSIMSSDQSSSRFLHIDGNKIGLTKYYNEEMGIYQILKSLDLYNKKRDIDYDTGISIAEKEQGFEYTDEQLDNITQLLKSNVSILTGKAGTGKTCISRGLLKCYKNSTIACAALSAKAAQRITEATGYSALTIHRLLKWNGSGFEHNRENPLPFDIVFIDEASMINCSLFYHLVISIKEGARLIIVGDDKQLPPIGHGNIFSDLLQKESDFNIVKLSKVFRQAEKSGILVDANKIRDGIFPIDRPEPRVISGELQDMIYSFRENKESLQGLAIRAYLSAIEQNGIDNVIMLIPRKKDCTNCTYDINNTIQDKIIPIAEKSIAYGKRIYKLGAKVIQKENNAEKNVFNGEIGYISDIWTEDLGKEKLVKFQIDFTMNDTVKRIVYKRSEIDQIDLAYALTIHSAQGSGYDTVIGIIDPSHFMLLDTCLLYTLITRAKQRCLLVADPKAFKKCISTNKSIARQTWLSIF
jgi:exodeoxyribonuclease V alpha subunit